MARAGCATWSRASCVTPARTTYDLFVVELDDGEILERDGYEIEAVAVSHRGPAFGYVFHEYDRPGIFDPEKAGRPVWPRGRTWAASSAARPSTASARTWSWDHRVPAASSRSPATRARATRCARPRTSSDVLIHESTFAIEDAERAHQTGHSTATQAAWIAREAEVKLLALNHFSIRYPVRVLRDEAREIFANTVLPRDFDSIEIPFAERGRAGAAAVARS